MVVKVSFPFEEGKSSIVGKIRRPVANVEFLHFKEKIWQPVSLIVDSGADYTLLPKFLAEPLGIDLRKDTTAVQTQGVGGNQEVYFIKHKMAVRLGKNQIQIRFGILNSNHVPPLLGRLDIFESFRITFYRSRTIFSSH
jgi:predicted aspartyl protease